VIQTFSSYWADYTFAIWILPRWLWSNLCLSSIYRTTTNNCLSF